MFLKSIHLMAHLSQYGPHNHDVQTSVAHSRRAIGPYPLPLDTVKLVNTTFFQILKKYYLIIKENDIFHYFILDIFKNSDPKIVQEKSGNPLRQCSE